MTDRLYPYEHAHMAMHHLECMFETGDVARGIAAVKNFPEVAIPARLQRGEPTREERTRILAAEISAALARVRERTAIGRLSKGAPGDVYP